MEDRYMKTRLQYCGLILLIGFIHSKSICQINPESNEFFCKTELFKINNKQNDVLKSRSITTISCDSNLFWAINSQGLLEQFIINGTSIIPDGVIDSATPGIALAICNNLNGGSMSPTFYIVNVSDTSILYYEGDTNWAAVAQTSTIRIYNAGGNGNYLYFQTDGFNYLNGKIIKYDGHSFFTFYTYDSLYFTVADIAVDNNGNVWCFSGSTSTESQFIDVISPLGQLIKRYNFVFNTLSAYGCFLLNDTIFLGLGSYNPVYPNSLLPIFFTHDSAYSGTPLSMPINTWYDLASCKTGSPLSIKGNKITTTSELKLYPNPVDNMITLEIVGHLPGSYNYLLSIYNIQGQLLQNQLIIQERTELDIRILDAGVYILKLTNRDRTEVIRVVKQ